jgi:hypothetical protein
MHLNGKLIFTLLQISGCCLGLFPSIASAAPSPLDYKTFVKGSALWISEPAGIMLYRSDTKSVRNIVLCDTVDNDSILDIVENSNALWILAKSGVYQIDYTTTTIEHLPGGKKGTIGGRLTVDDDYAWVSLEDTLWRFDKLGREWFPYPMNAGAAKLLGIHSNATNVYCVLPSSVKIFSTKDEKWLEFPNKKGIVISEQARFYLDKDVLLLVDGQNLFRYLINSQSWDVVKAPSPIMDLLSQDSVLYYYTSSGIFKYTTATSVTQPQDVPELSRIRSFSLSIDTLYCATNSNVIKYDMRAKSSGIIQSPQNISDFTVLKTILLGSTLITLCPKSIGVFNASAQFWENVPITVSGNKRKRVLWDDDNGLKLNYANGYSSQLTGSLQKNFTIDSLVLGSDSSFLYFQNQTPIANLTLHSTFTKGRYLDAFFDNSNISQIPKKGLFYRGASTDKVESGRLGTNTVDIDQSKTILTSQYEGANAVFQSERSLATRDRKIIKVHTGVGLIHSKTIYKVIPYSETGIYNIKGSGGESGDFDESDTSKAQTETSTSEIVPGSRKVFIDGEEIDTSYYNLANATGDLKFNRDDLLDPTSVITVSYQVQTIPDSGIKHVELLPGNHFGNLGYASIVVSPTDWISPHVGYYYLKTDSVHQLMNVSAPAEIRSSKAGLFLKINPEITLDAVAGKKAEALALQSRFGEKLSVFANALITDSGFTTTDNLDRGYGSLKHDADFKIAYDIKKELPLSYYQRDIASENGTERRYEVSLGSHFQGLPFCDLTLSRNEVNGIRIDSTVYQNTDTSFADTALIDTLDRLKDKFRIRLYETSSPFVESALHISRLKYDVSYTGFSSKMENINETGYGSIFYGNLAVSPINRLTLSINSKFLNNPEGSQYKSEYHPTITIQTIDAPPGVELSFRNEADFKSLSDTALRKAKELGATDTAPSKALVQRTVGLTLKPGTWTKYLSWISPLATYSQTVSCAFDEADPGFFNVLLAGKNVDKQTYTPGIGANIYPTNDIKFYNKDEWTTADSATKFFMLNDLKWWFGERRMWQTRWQYIKDRPRFTKGITKDNHDVSSQYNVNWNSWLQTIMGGFYQLSTNDSTSITQIGPKVAATFNKQKFSFIRDVMNNHTLKIAWITKNGRTEPSAEIIYNIILRLVVYPNISFYMNDEIAFKKGDFAKLSATIYGTLIF